MQGGSQVSLSHMMFVQVGFCSYSIFIVILFSCFPVPCCLCLVCFSTVFRQSGLYVCLPFVYVRFVSRPLIPCALCSLLLPLFHMSNSVHCVPCCFLITLCVFKASVFISSLLHSPHRLQFQCSIVCFCVFISFISGLWSLLFASGVLHITCLQ